MRRTVSGKPVNKLWILATVIVIIAAIAVIVVLQRYKKGQSVFGLIPYLTPYRNEMPDAGTLSRDVPITGSEEWETVIIPELKVKFSYPTNWTGFRFTREVTNTTTSQNNDYVYRSKTKGIVPPLSLTAYSQDYHGPSSENLTEKVNPNWNNRQFKNSLAGSLTVLGVKKLSDKALLTFIADPTECLPSNVVIYAPFGIKTPNLQISLYSTDYYYSDREKTTVYQYRNEHITLQNRACDISQVEQPIIDNWLKNGFPTLLHQKINLALHIADSVQRLP